MNIQNEISTIFMQIAVLGSVYSKKCRKSEKTLDNLWLFFEKKTQKIDTNY